MVAGVAALPPVVEAPGAAPSGPAAGACPAANVAADFAATSAALFGSAPRVMARLAAALIVPSPSSAESAALVVRTTSAAYAVIGKIVNATAAAVDVRHLLN